MSENKLSRRVIESARSHDYLERQHSYWDVFVMWEVRKRAYDGALVVWRWSPDAERACQWEIVAVHHVA